MPISEDLKRLAVERRRRPSDMVLAHDLGLAHYRSIGAETNGETKRGHWEQVIACWAPVLEDGEYWRDWADERSEVYGKEISEDHITAARANLREHLEGELARAAVSAGTGQALDLEGTFHLELLATRLLRQEGGLVPEAGAGKVFCGPLSAHELDLDQAVTSYFKARSAFAPSNQVLLERILVHLPDGSKEASAPPPVDQQQRLRMCFSDLGLPRVHLERRDPERALEILRAMRCPDCGHVAEQNDVAPASGLPACCGEGCAHLARTSPSYAGDEQTHHLHALELATSAHLASAHQWITAEPADIPPVARHLLAAVEGGRLLELGQALGEHVALQLRGWIHELANRQQFGEALELLEGTASLQEPGQYAGTRASMLNRRAVGLANEKQWAPAAEDLREACRLNSHVKLYQDNLANALKAWADEVYDFDPSLAISLWDEAGRVGQEPGKATPDEESEAAEPPAETEEEERTNHTELTLTETARGGLPSLVTPRGRLDLTAFTPSGQAVMTRAWQAAAASKGEILRPGALLYALAWQPGGETRRLLETQGVAPERLRVPGTDGADDAAALPEELPEVRLGDIRFDVLEALGLACEMAQFYDPWLGLIGEVQLLCGLLISGRADGLLERAGVDLQKMSGEVIMPVKKMEKKLRQANSPVQEERS